MSDPQVIDAAIRRAAVRLHTERIWNAAWRGLTIAAGLWLAALAIQKAAPVPIQFLPAAALFSLAALLGFVAKGASRKISPRDAAGWLDEKVQLRERLTTALEVTRAPQLSEWNALLLRDAASHAQTIQPSRLLPWRLPSICRWTLVLLALGASLGFVPEYRNPRFLQAKKDAENIKQIGKQVARLVRRTVNQRQPALESTKSALESVAQLGDHLAQTKLTRSEALKDLASATDKLKQESRDFVRNPALKKMEAAARTSSGSAASQNQDLQKKIDELNKSLGNKAPKPDALDQLRRDMQKLQQAGKSMADKDASSGDAAREQLSQAAAELARKAESMGIPLASLDEAIAALAANKVDQFLKDLNAAEQDLEKLQAMAQALQQLQQQAEKVGKDLAEQLRNGQAQAAISSLERLKAKIEKEQLSESEMKAALEEISKAIKPAGEYGKVAEYLKSGSEKLAKGEKKDAANALGEASKELAKMLNELGDANSLMATLDALKRAQMMIGNGQSWAMGEGFPGASQGGRPGRGVGTWADDSQFMDITDVQDGWDNSGFERADAEARGLSDRGEGNLADSLVPTRVKGQMSQGGPMPSITLRGVSIRGQSSVQYQEAVMSAQSDAQSALSQDQIPRAYQNAVKGYFDDFK